MSAIFQHHDAMFKSFMADITVARDFLKAHLPASLIAQCDMSTLHLENTSFISPEMRHRCSDALYSIKTKGEDVYVYMLLEHQSAFDEQMPLRLLEYQVAAMRRHIDQKRGVRPPLVIPILLFYQGKQSPYPGSLDIRDYIDQSELAWQFFPGSQLVDLTVIPDEAIQMHGHAAVYEMVMKHIRTRDIIVIFNDIQKLLLANPLDVDKVGAILQYLVEQGECSDDKQFYGLVLEAAPQHGEEIMTLAQQFRQEGRQEGAQEGWLAAMRTSVLNMLASGLNSAQIIKLTGFNKDDVNKIIENEYLKI